MIATKIPTTTKNKPSGLSYTWNLSDSPQTSYSWKGFHTGPLILPEQDIHRLCQKLLGIDVSELTETATRELKPVPSLEQVGVSVVLHSTTPDLKTFDGDLDKVRKGITPSDFTAYKEARAVYLAGEGDLAIGRIQPWKTATEINNVEALQLPGIDYYYASHALLVLAEQHLSEKSPVIERLLTFLTSNKNPVIRLYALEMEMQIFLIWIKRLAGLDYLLMDANSPEVAKDWNKKSVLFPTVQLAIDLENVIKNYTPHQILAEEAKHSPLRKLGCTYPVLPGYTVVRSQNSLESFTQQLLAAAKMLQQRYGLPLGCFKASDSGDGARIHPNVDLSDETKLIALAKDGYRHGDDYILEPHVQYKEIVHTGETLKASPSAHIRWGEVAPGATLQFTKGTSWKGNIYLDEHTTTDFGVTKEHYQIIQDAMHGLLHAFHSNQLGLAIAGLDFAIGKIGGFFGEEILIGVQDPNISFNGAECLRVFLEKTNIKRSTDEDTQLYGATRVFKPSKNGTLDVLHKITSAFTDDKVYADVVASVPERWAMIAVAHTNLDVVMSKLAELRGNLLAQGLVIE